MFAAMQGHRPPTRRPARASTLWAAMLAAWLAAGQAAPPPATPDGAEAPRSAGDGAAAAAEPSSRGA